MVSKKTEGPSSIWKEAEDLLEQVRTHKMHENPVDVDFMAQAAIDDIAEFPEVMFSYRELYVALRLLFDFVQKKLHNHRNDHNVHEKERHCLFRKEKCQVFLHFL